MNEQTWATVGRWQAAGVEVVVATVVRTYRSAPRPLGSIFAVSGRGEMAGSVSGGCVEGAVYGEAQTLLAGADGPLLLRYGISDDFAADVGLACGGEIWVALDHHRPRPALRRGALATVVTGPQAGRSLVFNLDSGGVEHDVDASAAEQIESAARRAATVERSTSIDLDDGSVVFVEAVAPAPRLVIVGAVDTAEAVCQIARTLGWRTVVIDPRGKFATTERLPSADDVRVAWTDEAYEAIVLEPADAVVVLTHDPKIDDPAIAGALRAGAFYVGALGSRRTQAKRRERLLDADVPAGDVGRVHGPIGLDIGADSPAETAVSIVAEVIARRANRTGAHLVEGSGPIHRTVAS